MMRVGGRAAAAQTHMRGDLGVKGPQAARGLRGWAGKINMNDRGARFASADLGAELVQRSADPVARRRFIIQIALDPLGDTGPAQRSETLIEAAAGFAELSIGAVAQRQHGVLDVVETRGGFGKQRFLEIGGALWR